MTETFATVNGNNAIDVHVYVPQKGPWWADVDFDLVPTLSGRVTLKIGSLELVGTVAPGADGTLGEQRKTRIVGGSGGWGTLAPPQHYHNDAGVAALTVAQDAARLAGETLGAFAPSAPTLGADYVRMSGPAALVLEDIVGSALWWVDYTGTTVVGTRPTATPDANSYQMIEFAPRSRLVHLTMDDFGSVVVGSVLSEGLDAPMTVNELEILVSAESAYMLAWCGGDSASSGRLAAALEAVVEHVIQKRLLGSYRYRVVRMSVDRVELQAVSTADGLPDLLPISLFPGVPGAHAQLTPGAHVLVTFVGGDRSDPIVTHFAGKDGSGWSPVSLIFDATTDMKLGATATDFVALASLVSSELATIRTWANAHVHTSATAGSPTSSPVTPLGAAGSVAATKVRAL